MTLTRRSLVLGLGAAGQGRTQPSDLLAVAATHVEIAEADQAGKQLWGRVGGSPAEHRSAAKLVEQLKPFLTAAGVEEFRFRSHRPKRWRVRLDNGKQLESAMPTPFNARFPQGRTDAALASVTPDTGWDTVHGKWAFLHRAGTTGVNAVREKSLYERAVRAGAAGLLFSIDTPAGRWRSVARIGKFWSVPDDTYPNGRRPIPCYAIDSDDGDAAHDAIRRQGSLSTSIAHEDADQLKAANTVGHLRGHGDSAILLTNHLDGFFAGANDNASGIATMVGIAAKLATIPEQKRKTHFYFAGLAAHHDGAAGMRAFIKVNPRRFARCGQILLIEHTDAVDTDEGRRAGWPKPLNNERIAYLGSQGWPEVRQALPALVRDTHVMTKDPKMVDSCVADLLVVCGKVKTFSLINTPPFYHTDHDTIDKISSRGLQAAVDFHLSLIEVLGGVEKGTFLR